MRIKDPKAIRDLLVPTVDPATADVLVGMIADSGALLDGHFRLQSGLHSQYFLRFGQLAFRAGDADQIAKILLKVVNPPKERLVVLGAETSARYLATAIAKTLGAQVAFAKVDAGRRPTKDLVSSSSLENAQAILIATDVLTTGQSIAPIIERARSSGPSWLCVAAFASLGPDGLSGVLEPLKVRGHCLMQARWKLFRPDNCKLCREGRELFPGFEFV